MRITFQLLVIILACTVSLYGQEIPMPVNYTIVDSVSGDLDNDGIKELAVAYNMRNEPDSSLENVPRELIIYKTVSNQWTLWKKSQQALYGSHDGGMMGDPFGSIQIQDGLLIINQNGGSSWKWSTTDKFRLRDGDFYLTGYTSNYGKLCEYWLDVDFNLSTGKLVVKKEYETCEEGKQEMYKNENETTSKKGLLITLENRNEQDIKLVTPKYNHEIFVATRKD